MDKARKKMLKETLVKSHASVIREENPATGDIVEWHKQTELVPVVKKRPSAFVLKLTAYPEVYVEQVGWVHTRATGLGVYSTITRELFEDANKKVFMSFCSDAWNKLYDAAMKEFAECKEAKA